MDRPLILLCVWVLAARDHAVIGIPVAVMVVAAIALSGPAAAPGIAPATAIGIITAITAVTTMTAIAGETAIAIAAKTAKTGDEEFKLATEIAITMATMSVVSVAMPAMSVCAINMDAGFARSTMAVCTHAFMIVDSGKIISVVVMLDTANIVNAVKSVAFMDMHAARTGDDNIAHVSARELIAGIAAHIATGEHIARINGTTGIATCVPMNTGRTGIGVSMFAQTIMIMGRAGWNRVIMVMMRFKPVMAVRSGKTGVIMSVIGINPITGTAIGVDAGRTGVSVGMLAQTIMIMGRTRWNRVIMVMMFAKSVMSMSAGKTVIMGMIACRVDRRGHRVNRRSNRVNDRRGYRNIGEHITGINHITRINGITACINTHNHIIDQFDIVDIDTGQEIDIGAVLILNVNTAICFNHCIIDIEWIAFGVDKGNLVLAGNEVVNRSKANIDAIIGRDRLNNFVNAGSKRDFIGIKAGLKIERVIAGAEIDNNVARAIGI